MGAIGIHHTETSDGGWDGPANERRLKADGSASYYRSAFAWQDPDGNAETKAAYRFIHHEVDGDGGVGAANLRACSTGIGVLNGGRGGSTIPAADRQGVYRHLAAHLKDADRDAPELAEWSGQMERKTGGEFKQIQDRVVTGFSSIFGNVDDGGDLVMPGAYRKTLSERGERLRWLWQHDMMQPPVAKILQIREAAREELPESVLDQFPEALGGLLVQREYLDTPRGNEVLAGLQAGAISEMSIGYDAIQVEYPTDLVVAGRPVRRRLKEIRLWECSDVNWGMNAATANLKQVDLDGITLEELIDQLETAGRLAELAQYLRQQDEEAAARAAAEAKRLQSGYDAMLRRVSLAQRALAAA